MYLRFYRCYFAFAVIILTHFSGCARYGLRHPQSLEYDGSVSVKVPDNFQVIEVKLRDWLKTRSLFEKVIRPTGLSQEVYYLTPWKRDFSLRYYYLEFDSRSRHISEWKSQWKLKVLNPEFSEIQVKVLEVIHMGPSNLAPAFPEIDEVKKLKITTNLDWAESAPDKIRALLELRRFFNETYPLSPLPAPLAVISVPSLEIGPLSHQWAQKSWTPVNRERSF